MDELLRFGRKTMNTRKKWSTHCWDIMPRWIKNWEDFAGKPYVKPKYNYPLGSVIRNTVSQAQDTLCGFKLGPNRRALSDYWVYYPGFHGGDTSNYPQSLGELCIELAQETLLEGVSVVPAFPGHRVAYIEWTQITDRFPNLEVNISISRRDIQKLRETMYHKHTSPEKERKTAKLERLIELVRNA